MKALVLEREEQLIYTDVPEPELVGEQPVLVRIAATGVCGSDLLRFKGGLAYHFPLILGHEFSAIVEQVPESSRYKPGDRVAVFPLLPNYRDPLSRIGEYAVSTGYDYFGSRRDGAFAERLWVPEENIVRIPDGVSLIHAAATEPAAVALHGMRKFNLPANAVALVIGGGAIGGFAAQWLRILGCSRVIVADIDERKRQVLCGLGFEVIDAAAQNTIQAVKELTNGRGVDCAVEASGLNVTLIQAIESCAVFGQVMLLGDIHKEVTLPPALTTSILRRELTLYGTWNSKITPLGNSEWEMVLKHMQKELCVAPLVSHTPRLADGPQVFADMAYRRIWYNKVIFAISDEARAEVQ